jgi:hypothetical protein
MTMITPEQINNWAWKFVDGEWQRQTNRALGMK